jgi:hypothetical protein
MHYNLKSTHLIPQTFAHMHLLRKPKSLHLILYVYINANLALLREKCPKEHTTRPAFLDFVATSSNRSTGPRPTLAKRVIPRDGCTATTTPASVRAHTQKVKARGVSRQQCLVWVPIARVFGSSARWNDMPSTAPVPLVLALSRVRSSMPSESVVIQVCGGAAEQASRHRPCTYTSSSVRCHPGPRSWCFPQR